MAVPRRSGQRQPMSLRGPVLAVLAATLLLPPAAPAAEVIMSNEGSPQARLVFLAAAGEANAVSVVFDGATLTITDTGAPVSSSTPACLPGSNANTVTCSASQYDMTRGLGLQLVDPGNVDAVDNSAAVTWSGACGGTTAPCIDYVGGNGVDTFSGSDGIDNVFTDEGNDVIDGRGGNDVLNAGEGDDSVTGSGGADSLRGEPGNDTLRADDGAADTLIDCFGSSSGSDGTADVAYVDAADPTPANCETVNAPQGGGGGGGTTGGGGAGGGAPGGGGGTDTGPTAQPTKQIAPTRVWSMPDLRPVRRKKPRSTAGKSRKYTYTKVRSIAAKLRRANLCPPVDSECADGDLQVEMRVLGGKSISRSYRGDAPNNVVWKQEPGPGTRLSPDQRVTFYYVDPLIDNDKECDLTDGAQAVHLKIADMTFEQASAWFRARDCKEGRDWRVVARTTVPTLTKTSAVTGVERGRANGRATYDLSVQDRRQVPPCAFARADEPSVLESFRSQGVRTAAEALATMSRAQCDAVVVATRTTPNATDPVVAGAKKVTGSSVYGEWTRFELTINQYVPQRQPGEPPSAGEPVLAKSDFCANSVSFGALSFKGTCLKREGFTWVSSGEVNVNGLKVVPNGVGAKVVLDPLNLRLAVSGEASVVLDAKLGATRVGPVTLYRGRFDWVFQYKPDLAGIAGVIMPALGDAGRGLSLPDIQRLPGLGGAGSLPKVGGLNLPNFGALDRTALEALAVRVPKIDYPNVEIPASVIPGLALPEIGFTVPQGLGSFLGFPLSGEVRAKLETRNGVKGARVNVNLALPPIFQGAAGSAALFVGADGTVQADAIGLRAAELWVGPTRLAPVEIAFDAPRNTWSGATKVFLFPGSPGVGGSFVVADGQLKQVGLSLEGELPLGPISLNRFDGFVSFAPLAASGTLAGSAGPSIPGLGPIIGLSSGFEFNQAYFKIEGDVRVANVPLANALVEYYTTGQFYAKGELSYFIDAARDYGFSGAVEGWATANAFNATGNVRFKAKSLSLEGKAVLSSAGVAGCAIVDGPFWGRTELGAGYRWGESQIRWIGGFCDLGPFSATVGRSAVRQAGTNRVSLPGGLDVASIAVEGTTGAPRVTLTGPNGARVTAPAGAESLRNDRFIVVQQAASRTTYLVIAKPEAGAWTVTAEPGSAPIARILSAQALPDPRVTATVSGRGARRTLRYTIKPIPGQSVKFVEEGARLGAPLGTATATRGTLAFRPVPGAAISRRIVAVIEQGGMVRTRRIVARYRAPGGILPAPRAKAVRKRAAVGVTWTRVPGAIAYRVMTRLNGRTVFATVKRPRAVVAGLLPTSGATVAVQALGADGRLGRAGRAVVRAPKVRRRSG